MSKFREPVEMSERDMEYRDHVIEELKSRTGQSMVTIIAYKENQLLSPQTINQHQTVLECRVGNQVSKLVLTDDMVGSQGMSLYYGMREITNRIIAKLIKAGAQAM